MFSRSSRAEGCAFIVILGNGSEVDLIARAYWGLKTEKWQGLGEVPCEFCCKHGKDSVEILRSCPISGPFLLQVYLNCAVLF